LNIEFVRHIFQKPTNVKLHENPSIGKTSFSFIWNDWQTDGPKDITKLRKRLEKADIKP